MTKNEFPRHKSKAMNLQKWDNEVTVGSTFRNLGEDLGGDEGENFVDLYGSIENDSDGDEDIVAEIKVPFLHARVAKGAHSNSPTSK